jgi:hypothetical protein
MPFESKRIVHQYTQINNASPEKVFPLLCPVREAEWVPDWKCRMIYSQSGVAELGCVFTTPSEHGGDTTWLVTQYDPGSFRIAYAWVAPALVLAQLEIKLQASSEHKTAAHIQYSYTGLSEQGNSVVEHYDRAWFEHKMKHWETAINYYLRTGTKIDAKAWE